MANVWFLRDYKARRKYVYTVVLVLRFVGEQIELILDVFSCEFLQNSRTAVFFRWTPWSGDFGVFMVNLNVLFFLYKNNNFLCLITDHADQYFRYELKLTSPEVDLLWSKLPVEKDGTVSFEDLVQHCFLNFNVTAPGGEDAASGEYTAKWQWAFPFYITCKHYSYRWFLLPWGDYEPT